MGGRFLRRKSYYKYWHRVLQMIRPDCLAMLWTVRPGLPNIVPGKQNIERMKKKMSRKLIIDGNAVYEIDEECMVKRRVNKEREGGERRSPLPEVKNSGKQQEK